ncbi:hypothetical protein Ancab_033914 [Ancistrocladus abbreviatus]
MAETEKGASSTSKKKEKMSPLDDDISKDLFSWKSMSVTEDDAMDFNFEPVIKGKKKAFGFDKMDMDFSLHGGFGKISSFKVDMSDLDFSSPPKISTEKSEGKSFKGIHPEKQTRFSFDFDFNELADFNLDAQVTDGGKKSTKVEGGKTINSLDKYECHASTIELDGDNVGPTKKAPGLEGSSNSKSEILFTVQNGLDSTPANYLSKSATSPDIVEPKEVQIHPEKVITDSAEDTDQRSCLADITTSKQSYTQQTAHDQIQLADKVTSKQSYVQRKAHDAHSETLNNDSTQAAISEKMVACFQEGESDDGSSELHTVDGITVTGLASLHENSQLKNSSSEDMKESKSIESQKYELESYDIQERVDILGKFKGHSNIVDGSANVSKVESNTDSSAESQKVTSELSPAIVGSESTIDRSVLRDKAFAVSQSKLPMAQDKSCSGLNEALSARTRLPSLDRNKMRPMQLGSITTASGEGGGPTSTRKECKLAGNQRAHASEGDSMAHDRSGNTKDHGASREGCDGAAAKIRNESRVKSLPHDKEVTNHRPVLLGSEKNFTDNKSAGSLGVQSSVFLEWGNQQHRNQDHEKLKLKISSIGSIEKLKINPLVGPKLSYRAAGRKMPGLSSLGISRNIHTQKDHPVKSVAQESKSLRNSDKTSTSQVNSHTAHSVCLENQAPPTPLKRRTSEVLDAGHATLPPSKRLLPSESRNFKEAPEKVVEEEVHMHRHLLDSSMKHVSDEHATSKLDFSQGSKMLDAEKPLLMENDRHVELAEAIAKELDALYNNLKKQHEEAKELLVQAVVNRNNFLLLSQPIHQQKMKISFPSSCMIVEFFMSRFVSQNLSAIPNKEL